MCTLNHAAAPDSTALAMVSAGLGYLAGCDAAGLGTGAQAEALVGLEQAEARTTAARARILSVFTAQGGFQADGLYGLRRSCGRSPRSHRGRPGSHRVGAAAADPSRDRERARRRADFGVVARQICDWTGQLPEDLHDLKVLAREMIERARTTPYSDGDGFADRALWLATTIGGAGRLQGDLTPECAASLQVILDALAGKGGPEDIRTPAAAAS
jgi:hypothetical protein